MVCFDKNGETGNIFWILGASYSELLKKGKRSEAIEMNDRVLSSGSYEEALKIIGEYVELEDVSYE